MIKTVNLKGIVVAVLIGSGIGVIALALMAGVFVGAMKSRPRIKHFTVEIVGPTSIAAGQSIRVREHVIAPEGCKISFTRWYVTPPDALSHGRPIDQMLSDVATPPDDNDKTVFTTIHIRQGHHMPYYEIAYLEGCGGLSVFFPYPSMRSDPVYIDVTAPNPLPAEIEKPLPLPVVPTSPKGQTP